MPGIAAPALGCPAGRLENLGRFARLRSGLTANAAVARHALHVVTQRAQFIAQWLAFLLGQYTIGFEAGLLAFNAAQP